jgi:cation-transporting P-type ATPase I
MSLNPGGLVSALAGRLPVSAGRRRRRRWVRDGRAHIEVKGAHLPGNADFARRVEDELARLGGVDWAEVNAVVGRVIVAFDDRELGVDDLIEVIEGVEETHCLAADRFPHERPEHPADFEALQRQVYAIGADVAGFVRGLAGRVVRASPLVGGVASLVSLIDATPALRRPLESRLGHAATDLGLAVGNAVAQGLAQGPFGLVVDIAHRGLRLEEMRARREVWHRREPELHGRPQGDPLPALTAARRPVPLPVGPVESYTDHAAQAALAGAAATMGVTRDPRMMVAAAVTATPKAARLGREGFAAWLGRDLAQSGVLAMDAEALRRLDRIDTVVLDAELLATGRAVLGAAWVYPEYQPQAEQVWLAARSLLDPANPAAIVEREGWLLGPAPRRLPGAAGEAARDLRAPGSHLLALRRDGALAGLVATEPELDPLAMALIAAARSAGPVIVAGHTSGAGQRLHADRVVAGGARLAASVRALQAEGHAVALISGRQHEALAASDVGIGVPAGPQPPWGAHLITGPGLADASRILQAVPPARAVSRRGVVLAAYGSGAGALLALAGPRAGAARRSLVAVNGAAMASLGSGAWSARTLARRPPPVPAATTDWHALAPDVVLAKLASTPQGLDDDEAARRRVGQPAGLGPEEPGVVRASLEELANPLTPALAAGAGMSAASGSVADAALIGTVLMANALIGGIQRAGASRALRHLIDESAVRVLLRRGDGEALTTADHLVVGDVIIVRAGDAVPADCRILVAHGLEVDESSLTGESQLVAKSARPVGAANVAERRSMLYAGTSVAAGTGTGVVVAVGPATELGRSAQATQGERRPSGVQARLRQLTRITVPISLGAGAALVAAGLLRRQPVTRTLGTGVSLAVAAVPEGLPFIATVAQLAAAQRLSRRKALVRNPGTIEALGRVDVLCFDKTGTLTEGRIRLHRVWAAGTDQPLGALDDDGRAVLAAALRASPEHRNGEPLAHPTDRAVVEGGAAAGVSVELGTGGWRLAGELPFEPSRGYHAVLGRTPSGHRLAVKGAPETVLPLCSHLQRTDGPVPLDEPARQALSDEADRLARRGYRVLAVAERDASGRRDLREDHVERLRFAGLLTFTDPVRESAARAVHGLRSAGVEVVMITGDHRSTAEAIAAELGLINGRSVVTGPELDALGDPELDTILGKVGVFARVTPEQKVRIVAALQRTGHAVAVTGDGANDAPAIRLADVGVALGLRGTNAAKEAADVVVTDDRIETIIDAIIEGRAMWASVRDALSMLLGGNLGEIAFTLGAGLLLPGGSPLNARQLLLVNLFTDLVPSMALAVRPPGGVTPESLLAEGPDVSLGTPLTRDVLIRGALTGGAGTAAWLGGRMTGITRARAGTIALVGVVGAQLGQTLLAGWRSPLVVAASLGSAVALAGVVQTPGVSHFFGCRPLGPLGWGIGVGAATTASLGAPLMPRLLTAMTGKSPETASRPRTAQPG